MNEINIAEPRLAPGREVFFRYTGTGKRDLGIKPGTKFLRHFNMAVGIVLNINKIGQVLIEHDGGMYNRRISDVFLEHEIKEQLREGNSFVVKGLHDIQEGCV